MKGAAGASKLKIKQTANAFPETEDQSLAVSPTINIVIPRGQTDNQHRNINNVNTPHGPTSGTNSSSAHNIMVQPPQSNVRNKSAAQQREGEGGHYEPGVMSLPQTLNNFTTRNQDTHLKQNFANTQAMMMQMFTQGGLMMSGDKQHSDFSPKRKGKVGGANSVNKTFYKSNTATGVAQQLKIPGGSSTSQSVKRKSNQVLNKTIILSQHHQQIGLTNLTHNKQPGLKVKKGQSRQQVGRTGSIQPYSSIQQRNEQAIVNESQLSHVDSGQKETLVSKLKKSIESIEQALQVHISLMQDIGSELDNSRFQSNQLYSLQNRYHQVFKTEQNCQRHEILTKINECKGFIEEVSNLINSATPQKLNTGRVAQEKDKLRPETSPFRQDKDSEIQTQIPTYRRSHSSSLTKLPLDSKKPKRKQEDPSSLHSLQRTPRQTTIPNSFLPIQKSIKQEAQTTFQIISDLRLQLDSCQLDLQQLKRENKSLKHEIKLIQGTEEFAKGEAIGRIQAKLKEWVSGQANVKFGDNEMEQLRTLIGRDSDIMKKLEARYGQANQQYLDQLRNEQENFLAAYRFLSSIINRIKTLTETIDDFEEARLKTPVHNVEQQFTTGARFKKIVDFVKLNFGSIEWEMEGFKKKIMINTQSSHQLRTAMPFSRSTSATQQSEDINRPQKSLTQTAVKKQRAQANFETITALPEPHKVQIIDDGVNSSGSPGTVHTTNSGINDSGLSKLVWSGINLEQYYNDYLQGGSKNTTLTKQTMMSQSEESLVSLESEFISNNPLQNPKINQAKQQQQQESQKQNNFIGVPFRDESTPTFNNQGGQISSQGSLGILHVNSKYH